MARLPRDAQLAILAFAIAMLAFAVAAFIGYDAWTTNP
jgi:hypothetical protein